MAFNKIALSNLMAQVNIECIILQATIRLQKNKYIQITRCNCCIYNLGQSNIWIFNNL